MVRKVLIVDDEEDVRRALRVLLEEEVRDVEVICAEDAQDAFRVLANGSVDLILSDHRMPGLDGVAFLAEARRRHGPVPAVLLTAYPDPSLATRAITEAGAGVMVAKPMDLDYLLRIVRAVLDDPPAFDADPRVFRP